MSNGTIWAPYNAKLDPELNNKVPHSSVADSQKIDVFSDSRRMADLLDNKSTLNAQVYMRS